jgi:hypothetical protein
MHTISKQRSCTYESGSTEKISIWWSERLSIVPILRGTAALGRKGRSHGIAAIDVQQDAASPWPQAALHVRCRGLLLESRHQQTPLCGSSGLTGPNTASGPAH